VRQESVLSAVQSACRVVGKARSGPIAGCREPAATPSMCQLDAALPIRLKIACLESQKRKFLIKPLCRPKTSFRPPIYLSSRLLKNSPVHAVYPPRWFANYMIDK